VTHSSALLVAVESRDTDAEDRNDNRTRFGVSDPRIFFRTCSSFLLGDLGGTVSLERKFIVTNYYTHYWNNETFYANKEIDPTGPMEHTAGNLFRARGVTTGDYVYVVTALEGKLYLIGRMEVGEILNYREARKKLSFEPWEAEDQVLALPGTATPTSYERRVPDDITASLRFYTSSKRTPSPLKFVRPGRLDQQTLRGVREMTPDSADLLEKVLNAHDDEMDDEMDDDESRPPADYGYDDQYAYLRICPTCFELYERGRPDPDEQRCQCQPVGPRWSYTEFNQRAILCQCCGFNVLRSGSRWSPFFCWECQLLAMAVSVWNRRLIFPIGRHSLMHTWVPDTPSPSLSDHGNDPEALAESVYTALSGVARGTDGLSQWYRTIMPRNLKTFGLKGDVSLREYIEAVAAEAPAVGNRVEAFEGLCRLFQSDPLETPRKN
jgi:hypothetical protein